MLVKSIKDLNLNDSDILGITIDKSNADGGNIILHLDYIEDYETMASKRRDLIFIGCRSAVLRLNFGVVTPDAIRSSNELDESVLLTDARSLLIKMNVVNQRDLKHFHIETSSTASEIDVVAEILEISDEIRLSTPTAI